MQSDANTNARQKGTRCFDRVTLSKGNDGSVQTRKGQTQRSPHRAGSGSRNRTSGFLAGYDGVGWNRWRRQFVADPMIRGRQVISTHEIIPWAGNQPWGARLQTCKADGRKLSAGGGLEEFRPLPIPIRLVSWDTTTLASHLS